MIIQYYKFTPGFFDYTWAYLVMNVGVWCNECEWIVPGTESEQ